MLERIAWENMPNALKDAIEARTGPILAGRTATAGQNSALAAFIDTADGTVFVKGIPADHPRVTSQAREAAVAPLVREVSPALLWSFEETGWSVLGYEYVQGRHADYRPGSPDLDAIVELMSKLATVTVPAEPASSFKRAQDRWKTYATDPALLDAVTGSMLLHTDWIPDNVLIGAERGWLLDWAWPTLGAAWVDPACWLLRLIACGHTPAQAERVASRLRPTRTPTPQSSTCSPRPTSTTGPKWRPPHAAAEPTGPTRYSPPRLPGPNTATVDPASTDGVSGRRPGQPA